jgi:hypothetical protein
VGDEALGRERGARRVKARRLRGRRSVGEGTRHQAREDEPREQNRGGMRQHARACPPAHARVLAGEGGLVVLGR